VLATLVGSLEAPADWAAEHDRHRPALAHPAPRRVWFYRPERPGPRGITEIRAVLGGAFIGLGAAPFILQVPQAYLVLGITYLVIAATLIGGMIVDKSVARSNIISLATEIVLGVVLVL
jgi:hypothetical protein